MDYSKVLERMRDARSKRSKSIITKKFFDTVRQENGPYRGLMPILV